MLNFVRTPSPVLETFAARAEEFGAPLLVVMPPSDLELVRQPAVRAATAAEAHRLLRDARPRAMILDWDLAELDAELFCRTACRELRTIVLTLIGGIEAAPVALRAGCHGILLKPVTPNLIAARLGRLVREVPRSEQAARVASGFGQYGTNRRWDYLHCPACNQPGAVSFEFSSYRRSWYACLRCEAVWLGRR